MSAEQRGDVDGAVYSGDWLDTFDGGCTCHRYREGYAGTPAGQWNGWAVFTVTRPVMAAIVARQHTTMVELMAQSMGQEAGDGRHLDEAWLDVQRHLASMSWLGDLVVIDSRVLQDDPTLVEVAAPDRRGRYRVGFGWTWVRVAAASCHTVHTG